VRKTEARADMRALLGWVGAHVAWPMIPALILWPLWVWVADWWAVPFFLALFGGLFVQERLRRKGKG
jgi:hypothetical protein